MAGALRWPPTPHSSLAAWPLLGRRIPQSLRVFMLSLAIVDDIGAILVVAIGYGGPLDFAALAFGGLGIAIVVGMGLLGIRSIPIYFLVGGLTRLAVDASGIHATVTGVILGLLTPTRRWVSEERLRAPRTGPRLGTLENQLFSTNPSDEMLY